MPREEQGLLWSLSKSVASPKLEGSGPVSYPITCVEKQCQKCRGQTQSPRQQPKVPKAWCGHHFLPFLQGAALSDHGHSQGQSMEMQEQEQPSKPCEALQTS